MSITDIPRNRNQGEVLEGLLERSYQQVGLEKGIDPGEVRVLRECRSMTTLLILKLMDETDIEGAGVVSRSDGVVDEHRYVRIPAFDGGETVIDPMWQQFVPSERRIPELPHALVGSRDQVQAIALQAGVDPTTVEALWGPETEQNTQRYLTPHEKVALASDTLL